MSTFEHARSKVPSAPGFSAGILPPPPPPSPATVERGKRWLNCGSLTEQAAIAARQRWSAPERW